VGSSGTSTERLTRRALRYYMPADFAWREMDDRARRWNLARTTPRAAFPKAKSVLFEAVTVEPGRGRRRTLGSWDDAGWIVRVDHQSDQILSSIVFDEGPGDDPS
jgi:hypothetical protein